MGEDKIKIMISSTIRGNEALIYQICSILQGFGYQVWSSLYKTIPVYPRLSNTENCLKAVETCDCLLGIIFPRYGNIPDVKDGRSITHREMSKGIELQMPCWFAAHRDVYVACELVRHYMYLNDGKTVNKDFKFERTSVLEDARVIDIYNEAIKGDIGPIAREEHWVDEFFNESELLKIVDTQFKDIDRIKGVINK